MKFENVAFFVFSVFWLGQAENILSVAFWSTKSHKITYQPLLEALAVKGHNVTVISSVPSKVKVPNLHELLSADIDTFLGTGQVTGMRNVFEMKEQKEWNLPTDFIHLTIGFCNYTLDQPQVNDLLTQKFDLILIPILYNECSAAFAHKFNVSTVLISPLSVVGHISSLYGNPSPPSFVPNAFTECSDRMTFRQRTINFLTEGLIRGIYNYRFIPGLEKVYRGKFNDPNFASMESILKNSSIILSNSHFSLSYPRPFLPDIIEVGGMHCQKSRKLPKDLSDFVESSGPDGFILFSMGSNLPSSDLPVAKRQIIVEAFSKLKQKILWKWELDTGIPGLSENVKLSKWLPQQDLLGHSKIKAFITHGGFGSTTEAACHGTPLVGIPIYADQAMNMELTEKAGVGLTIDFATLSVDSLLSGIQRVVNTPSYKENAQLLSHRLLDQPSSALDRAVYWTEYVMRHGGATHLRSAGRDLNFFQYHSLDVVGFLVVTTFFGLGLLLVGLRYFVRKLWNFFSSHRNVSQNFKKRLEKGKKKN